MERTPKHLFRCHPRLALIPLFFIALLILWGTGREEEVVSAKHALKTSPQEPPVKKQEYVPPFGTRNDIIVVPSGESTFLCNYMNNVTKISGGCVTFCGKNDHEGGEDFNVYIRSERSEKEVMFADVIVNHNGPVPKRKSTGRPYLTVFYSGESNKTDRNLARQAYQKQYDTVISFHQHRKYYFTWVHIVMDHFLKIINANKESSEVADETEWLAWQKRKSAIAVFVSNCKASRANALRRLSKYYTVHSFGKCLRNSELPPDCAIVQDVYAQKLCVFQKYKYAMSMENSNEKDYVTEKVYNAFLAGTVPLYSGAPNIEEFLPLGRNSIVDVEHFIPGVLRDINGVFNWSPEGGFRKLGDYLRQLERDKVAVKRLLAWRHVKRVEEWGEKFVDNLFHPDPVCAFSSDARIRRSKLEGK